MTKKIVLFQVPASLPSAVRAFLEEEIIFGRLEPGSRLTEADLATRYSVSRSPIREALFQLEKDMLVVREPRRGFRVATISEKELDEIYACRIALEAVAAEEAAAQRSAEDCRQLSASLRSLNVAAAERDVEAYFRWNVMLTNQIHAAANNDTLIRLLDGIGKSALRYRYFVYSRRPDKLAGSLAGNRRIVAAISSGDGRAARRLTEDLIRDSWTTIKEALNATVASAEGKTA